MHRYWLFTSTTYGTWLPGDRRGFVSNVGDKAGSWVRHNLPSTPVDEHMEGLEGYARKNLKGKPIYLHKEQAEIILAQLQETAEYRKWDLLAVAIMANHFHIVVRVKGDPDPNTLLRDFKSYASRALNRKWGKPESETWWTESGSKRKLPNEEAVRQAIEYVRNQQSALLVWIAGERGRKPPV